MTGHGMVGQDRAGQGPGRGLEGRAGQDMAW